MTNHTAGQPEPSAPSRGSVEENADVRDSRIANTTDHDAVPAAKAVSDEARTDKAATSHRRDRPGDTPADTGTTQPRNGAVRGPDPDSRVWETHTPQPQATPGECSNPREGTSEPVAWAVVYPNGEVAVIAFKLQDAEERATASDRIVPLYRSPTLTDAERDAVQIAVEYVGSAFQVEHHAATLRGLLERLGGNNA